MFFLFRLFWHKINWLLVTRSHAKVVSFSVWKAVSTGHSNKWFYKKKHGKKLMPPKKDRWRSPLPLVLVGLMDWRSPSILSPWRVSYTNGFSLNSRIRHRLLIKDWFLSNRWHQMLLLLMVLQYGSPPKPGGGSIWKHLPNWIICRMFGGKNNWLLSDNPVFTVQRILHHLAVISTKKDPKNNWNLRVPSQCHHPQQIASLMPALLRDY